MSGEALWCHLKGKRQRIRDLTDVTGNIHAALSVVLLQCDSSCSVGTQYREVVCIVRRGQRKIIIHERQCESQTKPETTQSCDSGPCDGLQWITSQWSGVSKTANE